MTREEFEQELREDARRECLLRSNYDYFLEDTAADIVYELDCQLNQLDALHSKYGWDFDKVKFVKEWL